MATPRRNVLLITADQWRADCLSAYGHPCVSTPNFDRLIADGMAFNRHYSVCAPCGPARASLLTGMYMQNHRSVRNGTPLDDRHTNIAREMRRADYIPRLFGYTDTSLDPNHYDTDRVLSHGYENLMPGFEEGLLLPAEKPDAWLDYLREEGFDFDTLEEAYRPVPVDDDSRGRTWAPAQYSADQSQTAFLTRKTIDYLENAEGNWFVHLSYLRPHPPFIAPAPYHDLVDPQSVPLPARASAPVEQAEKHPWLKSALGLNGDWFDPWMREILGSERYEIEMRQIRATYYGLIAKVDHYVGQVLQCLRDTGQYDDTLIILTSDHGELLGDQWLFGKRGFFDSGYAIPLVIRAPGMPASSRNERVDAFTESVDIMPTILEWLGRPVPRQCDGASLLPFLFGNEPPDWRSEAHWEYDFRDVVDEALEQELGIAMDQCQLNVIRNRRYKYVHFADLPPLFFDLEADPGECHNLAEQAGQGPRVLEMCRKMLSWRMANDERAMTDTVVSRERIYTRRPARQTDAG